MKLPNDPIILEMLPEFIDTWLDDLTTLFPALVAAKNSQDLYRMGHTIKGSCAQFGLDEVSLLGIELMTYAKAEQWDKAMALRTKIQAAILEVKKYLETM
ncbi:MAG: Hpt domain-containing protein [Ignavibacteria bacterium]|nr:Hpt domain-containing protein [Ignavibacteria bacterium]